LVRILEDSHLQFQISSKGISKPHAELHASNPRLEGAKNVKYNTVTIYDVFAIRIALNRSTPIIS